MHDDLDLGQGGDFVSSLLHGAQTTGRVDLGAGRRDYLEVGSNRRL